ncbi:unnamed protein product [Rotaria sp. Silwood2]|nr:unnamed protein product [Rotaria sp. Silwood2]CAF4235075.1 unnamed protein product [Rotaria sp. Silwood2]
MPNTVIRTTVNTSFENTLLAAVAATSVPPIDKPRISLKQLCFDLGQYLKRYDSILTIKQWAEVEKAFCSQHGIENFFGFHMMNEDNDSHNPLSLLSFLHLYRQRIDSNGHLSVYENAIPTSNRKELYTFVNQLLRNYDNRVAHADSNASIQNSTNRPIFFSANQLAAVEKGIKHKFGSLLGFQGAAQIINKIQQQKPHSMIYFEESLLDVVSLNRLDICPSSLPIDETQLCKLILQCPIMIDLNTWLQWLYFFQPRYGSLKTFIARKQTELDGLLLLETSTHELFRLPIESSLTHFEQELAKMNVRLAVGYLCTSIIFEHIHVNRLPLSIYRQVMHTWFIVLQSSATFGGHKSIEPMEYILEFLIYLPALIGQTLIVQELVLAPLDDVFRTDDREKKSINNRQKLWMLANDKQKNKLEMWGYLLDIKEWKNTTKWIGQNQSQIESTNERLFNMSKATENLVKDNTQLIVAQTKTDSILSTTTSHDYVNSDKEKRVISDNDSIQAAYEHIESIRRGFGVNCGLDSTGQSIVNNLQGMIERSLEKLSNDLYSEQGHFVLELIQNADDNQYLSNRIPTLRFILSSERILVCNNETGFQPMHISAICNVGTSTKGKHKQGYAGHKGINSSSHSMKSD